MDRGAWWATVHGVTKESDVTEQLNLTMFRRQPASPSATPAQTGVLPWGRALPYSPQELSSYFLSPGVP